MLLTSLNALALALRPFTVVRTRGYLYTRSDQTAAAEDQSFAYGECVVSDQASAIGVTAVPTPITDGDSDLFYLFQLLKTSSGILSGTSVGVRGAGIEIDSRAMRKVNGDQDLITVVESDLAGVTAGQVVATFSRLLVKLH